MLRGMLNMIPLYLLSLETGPRQILTRKTINTLGVTESSKKRRLFDCDLNLTYPPLIDDARNLLARAASVAGLAAAVVPGNDLSDSNRAIKFAEDKELQVSCGVKLLATFGVHPYRAKGPVPIEFGKDLRVNALRQSVAAVGECGLDTTDGFPPIQDQLEWFRVQLDIACELRKPLFLHERGAHELFLKELDVRKDRLPERLLVHCFTGNEEELRRYLDFGCFISVAGLICRTDKEGKRFREVIASVQPPLERLMIETDAPFMHFPGCRRFAVDHQWKERPNDPSAIIHVAEALAKVLKCDIDDLCESSFRVAQDFFGFQ